MGLPRLQHRAAAGGATVPLTPGAALIRERLVERRRDLAAECPEALDRTALMLEVLHDALWGRAAEVAVDRSPRYRRAQLSGERALPLEDLVAVALHAPVSARPAVEELAAICVRTTVPVRGAAGSIHLENAEVLGAFGAFEQALQLALADGILSARERLELLTRLRELTDEIQDLAPAIREAR